MYVGSKNELQISCWTLNTLHVLLIQLNDTLGTSNLSQNNQSIALIKKRTEEYFLVDKGCVKLHVGTDAIWSGIKFIINCSVVSSV